MARKVSADFNTHIHDIFERISRGESSPHRLSRRELGEALETTESAKQVEPADRKDAESD